MNDPCKHCGRPFTTAHGGFARCASGPTAWETQYEPAIQSHELYQLTSRFALSEDREWLARLTGLYHEAIRREQERDKAQARRLLAPLDGAR